MGFSLAGFGAGFAAKATERLDEERVRSEKLQDEARQVATRQRLAKQAKREQEKALAEEMVGSLKMLGFDDETASSIAGMGKGAGQVAITQGTLALEKGIDPNTLWNMSSVQGDGSVADNAVINDTIAAATPSAITDSSLEATSTETTATEGKAKDDILTREFGINTEVWESLYKKPEKIESSYSARLAVISQKIARPTKDTDVEALASEREDLLADLREMKAAERAEEGTESPSFTLGTISANVSEIRRGAMTRYGFDLGIDGQIENLNDGNQHLADIASMEIASQLTARNKDINDPTMANTAQAINSSAISGLKTHGNAVRKDPKRSASVQQVPNVADFAAAAEQRQYSPGQVIQTTGNDGNPMFIVYTGINDIKTGMPFIVLSNQEGM
jgi:uncharacterized protein with von Willebrand factor type A (vWA) domain